MNDIYSLTDFQRNTKDHIERMKKTRRPTVLTINGRPELVVLEAEEYQKMLEEIDRAEALEGIRKGFESWKRGEGRPALEVLEDLRKKHNIPK